MKNQSLTPSPLQFFGAGPAYISYSAKLLSEIASINGFENSEPLIGDVLGGTYEIHNSKNKPSFEKIKSMVASKGGATEAALKKLNPREWMRYGKPQ